MYTSWADWMARWAKCLLLKCEELSSNPKTHVKKKKSIRSGGARDSGAWTKKQILQVH